jgi:hypothetical protein
MRREELVPNVVEWIHLSARIHGLVKAAELGSAMFAAHGDSVGMMKHLGESTGKILDELAAFGCALSAADGNVRETIHAEDKRLRPLLSNSSSTQEMRQLHIRTALVGLAALEAEVSYLLSDHQAGIRSRVERAFQHLQRLIVVDHDVRDRWGKAFQAGEVECEKLGAVHLLSHGIWAFKVNAAGGRTDLVYQEPLQDTRAVASAAEGLVLTEWKKCGSGDKPERQFAAARTQAKDYAAGVLGGVELTRVRYAILVSEESITIPDDVTEGRLSYRHLNVAVAPGTPSKRKQA